MISFKREVCLCMLLVHSASNTARLQNKERKSGTTYLVQRPSAEVMETREEEMEVASTPCSPTSPLIRRKPNQVISVHLFQKGSMSLYAACPQRLQRITTPEQGEGKRGTTYLAQPPRAQMMETREEEMNKASTPCSSTCNVHLSPYVG